MTDEILTSDHEREQFTQEFADHVVNNPKGIQISCDRLTAWAVMQACQYMIQHPLTPESVRQILIQHGRALQTEIAIAPMLVKVAEEGWKQDVLTRAAQGMTKNTRAKPQA